MYYYRNSIRNRHCMYYYPIVMEHAE
jgi:hypothetical protein